MQEKAVAAAELQPAVGVAGREAVGRHELAAPIGIGDGSANGAIRFLNIAGTDLPSRASACIRDTVASARLGSGAAASWRHRINF